MGLNFYYYDGLQPKMSAGMIKLHECIFEWNLKRIDVCQDFDLSKEG